MAQVSIKGEKVVVDSKQRKLSWGSARHDDCEGMISSVEDWGEGLVRLVDGHVFQNPIVESNSRRSSFIRKYRAWHYAGIPKMKAVHLHRKSMVRQITQAISI